MLCFALHLLLTHSILCLLPKLFYFSVCWWQLVFLVLLSWYLWAVFVFCSLKYCSHSLCLMLFIGKYSLTYVFLFLSIFHTRLCPVYKSFSIFLVNVVQYSCLIFFTFALTLFLICIYIRLLNSLFYSTFWMCAFLFWLVFST